MNATTDDVPAPARPVRRSRARFELAIASGLLAVGLFALPAVIFVVGVALLGPYGDNQGMGAFYGNFFRDLAEPSGRTWAIALGPLLLVSLARLLWIRRPAEADDQPGEVAAAQSDEPIRPKEHKRIEPSVSID